MRINADMEALFARLDDLCRMADKGSVAISPFLTPRELHYAQAYLARNGASFFCYGGHAQAERRRVYILPDYVEAEGAQDLAEYGFDADISAVRVTPSGYRSLTHRDYMGSVLGLGIERAVIGDIAVYGDGSAVIFCDSVMSAFLTDSLVKVANDKVRTELVPICDVSVPEKRFADINDTVASPRLDCVVGAICSLSREKAKSAVESGLVEVEFECEERPDREVVPPCTVSVKGYGRFEVLSVSDKTKKGRYRLSAKKYL